MWPFRRRSAASKAKARHNKRKKKARKAKAKQRAKERLQSDAGPTQAELRRRELEAARRQGRSHAAGSARAAAERIAKQRKKYVPPPVPDDLDTLPAGYRAPEGHAVWQWLKTAPIEYFVEAWPEQDPEGFEDFSKWPRADLPKGVQAIRRHVLELILAASQEQYPNEFGGMLRAEKGIIEELILSPGTQSGATSAIFQFHMMPVDMSVVGTIHSHPSPVPYPSAADTSLFERYGRIHIITGYPFGENDWRAFDHKSRLVPLRLVD